MAKKLSPQTLVSRLKDDFSYKELSAATGYSERQLQRIKSGQASGAKAEAAIREFYDLGKRAQAQAIKGEKKIEHRRERPVKAPPVEEPEPVPEAAPAPPEHGPITVDFWGEMGPWEMDDDEDNYVRDRNIRTTLTGDDASRFAELWKSGDKFSALEIATQNYFDKEHGIGPGFLKSYETRPSIDWGK